MKLKHREFILGILLGSVIFAAMTVFADNVLDVVVNPFKIKVNGEETFIEGYNINGNSYFKLRDIGKYTGFDVDFKEDTIMINTQVASTAPLNTQQEDEIEIVDGDTIKISGDLHYYFQYINRNILEHTVIVPVEEGDEKYTLNLCKKDTMDVLLENIPNVLSSKHMYISNNYLNDVILPLDN